MKILAISGSLRRASSNTALLRAAAALAPPEIEIIVYEELGSLPLFNPDLEGAEPHSVLNFRSMLKTSDGIIISSPEYAHGITGVLKNALDWVVGSGEFVDKPVALINASPRARHAQESLTEIITVMAARIIPEASLTIPLPTNKMDPDSILAHPELSKLLRTALSAFIQGIKTPRTSSISTTALG